MVRVIEEPAVISAVGNMPKRIEEYVGRVRTGDKSVSVAWMRSPAGWREPGQRPEFQEITLVLRGTLCVEHEDGVVDVKAGQAVIAEPGQCVRYSTPHEEAEYIAICTPGFSPDTVHRESPCRFMASTPAPASTRETEKESGSL